MTDPEIILQAPEVARFIAQTVSGDPSASNMADRARGTLLGLGSATCRACRWRATNATGSWSHIPMDSPISTPANPSDSWTTTWPRPSIWVNLYWL